MLLITETKSEGLYLEDNRKKLYLQLGTQLKAANINRGFYVLQTFKLVTNRL